MLKRLQRSNAGDTIVEVLIVLAIVGLALGISYATADRSLKTVRQSQEHAQALQLIQGQIEQLKAALALTPPTATSTFISKNNSFCYTSISSNPSGTAVASTDPLCKQDSLYHLSVSCEVVAGKCSNLYTASAQWNSLIGSGQDSVSLAYRVYGS